MKVVAGDEKVLKSANDVGLSDFHETKDLAWGVYVLKSANDVGLSDYNQIIQKMATIVLKSANDVGLSDEAEAEVEAVTVRF